MDTKSNQSEKRDNDSKKAPIYLSYQAGKQKFRVSTNNFLP